MRRSTLRHVWAFPVVFQLSACYEESVSAPAFQDSLTRVYLADAPFTPGTLGSVEVYVVEISASTDDEPVSGVSQWLRIAEPNRRFDLLQLRNGESVLAGEASLPAARYRALRVTINCDSSAVTWSEGGDASVLWPESGLTTVYAVVEEPIFVPDSGASIVVDFDVGGSLSAAPDLPDYDFTYAPTLRAVSLAATGAIEGTVLGFGNGSVEPLAHSSVTVFRGKPEFPPDTWEFTTSGYTDSLGYYKIGFLLAGSYSVQIDPPAAFSLGSLVAHDVLVVAGEEFQLTVTLPTGSGMSLKSWR